jgi:UDP:flavonoid glycosyltransferase YjiC (YdhE family)
MDVVMTTGNHRRPEDLDLGPRAPNIRVEAWIPLTDLVKHTDVVVTTGGSSTIMTTLKAGVPMVVVPDEWDRPENGRRIAAVGAGVVVPFRECTPGAIRKAVEQVLNEPSFRRRAQEMAEALARYSGPDRAAELLETLVPDGNRGAAAAPQPEPAISSKPA